MRKLSKKLTTAVLAVALLLTTAFGGLSIGATPIVDFDEETGSLTIHKVDENGDDLPGAEFTLYKIMSLEPSATPGKYSGYEIVGHYEDILENVSADELGNYSAAGIEALADQLAAEAADDTAAIPMDPTDDDGLTTEDELEFGYYLVIETKAPSGYTAIRPFFVAIPSTDNYDDNTSEGTEWVYDITISPKNEKIPIDKKLVNAKGDHENGTDGRTDIGNSDTVGLNDIVRYQVSATVPTYTAEYFDASLAADELPRFIIYDDLSDGLEIITGSAEEPITVKIEGGATLTAGTDYTLAAAPTKVAGEYDLKVTMSQSFLANPAYHGKKILVDYSAKVTSDAVIGEEGNPNRAHLEYTTRPGLDFAGKPYIEETPDIEKIVYTYDLELFKTEEGKKVALKDAKFELYKADIDGEITDTKVGTTKTTGADGKIRFEHLDAGVYYLKEVESPAGYTLLTSPVKIQIVALTDANGDPTGKVEFYINGSKVDAITAQNAVDGPFQSYVQTTVTKDEDDEDVFTQTGVLNVTIENKKGFSLPSTGGMGITIFLAIAFIGITSISVVLMKKKRA